VGRAIGIAFQGDRGHRDHRTGGQARLQRVIGGQEACAVGSRAFVQRP
jgi:hypothetical protein